MLTLEQLKAMEPDTIFATGVNEIPHPWYGQSPEYPKTVMVKWVATRGGIHDWAIYHSFHTNLTMIMFPDHVHAPDQMIKDHGEKLHDEELIKRFVPCDAEAFEMYRH